MVGWLEADRRLSISAAEVRERLGWPNSTTRNVLSRLAGKGWLRRTARGRYEMLLAETGGWLVPNPWAALSTWGQRYYVGFASAAYEHGLTLERPGHVQACVPVGAKRPRAWSDIPIVLVFIPTFDEVGVITEQLHGFPVRLASPEKVIVDAASLPGRIGGVLGLARVVDQAFDRVDWREVVRLSQAAPRGKVSARRTAALLDILGQEIPKSLADAAATSPRESPLFLGDRRTYGAQGTRLTRWQVVVNVDASVLREEVSR